MKKVFYVMLPFLCAPHISGQTNLVVNPSFEAHTGCPTNLLGEIYLATGWDNFTGSVDYFSTCGTPSTGVPGNFAGYQMPASGNAYSGLITYNNFSLYHEILGGSLQVPLTVAQTYYFSFMICRGNNNVSSGYSTNKIGIKFTQTNSYTASVNNYSLLVNNTAHYFDNNVITDTLNWKKIKGSFIADSAYKYLMIGNFFDDSQTIITTQFSGIHAYYYIDDVCVSTDSTFATNWTGLKEASHSSAYKVYPNPASDFISFENLQHTKQNTVLLIDRYGQIVLNTTMPTSNKIDITDVASGLYLIQLISTDKTYSEKILIQH